MRNIASKNAAGRIERVVAAIGLMLACWLGGGVAVAPLLTESLQAQETTQEASFDAAEVRDHFQRGRYEMVIELAAPLTGVAPVAEEGEAGAGQASTQQAPPDITRLACWWQARAHLALGQQAEAARCVQAGLSRDENDLALLALQARQDFEGGNWVSAEALVARILQDDTANLSGRLLRLELLLAKGDYKPAEEAARWFVRYYNKVQPTDADELLLVAEGSLQYARMKSATQVFDFVLNTVLVDALKADPLLWQAQALSGRLLLEKYNLGEGIPELQAALATNPQAADVHATLAGAYVDEFRWDEAQASARTALEINPTCTGALLALVEAAQYEDRTLDAEAVALRAYRVSPRDAVVRGTLAGVLLTRPPVPPTAELTKWLDEAAEVAGTSPPAGDSVVASTPADPTARVPTSSGELAPFLAETYRDNARPALFLAQLGKLLEARRRLPQAELCYRRSIEAWPQLSLAKNNLGLLAMQQGRTDEARRLLEEAFELDPYHVRISNMRKVLKVLDGYPPIETEHFLIRADTKLDRLLARSAARYLEELYPQLTQEFGFEPPARTQIEIYNAASGRTAHEWFSARMIGLPWIQTIGASTGMMIAMASPSGLDQPMNWGRVLKHEYVHVITLQQTDFNIPVWFTEALATRSEQLPRPLSWDKLLMERVPAGRLRTLENINLGFQRAADAEDWNFAYCQSVLYADYLIERFGADSVPKLLEEFRQQRSTTTAIQNVTGVSLADFEQGYRDFLNKLVDSLRGQSEPPALDAAEVEADYRRDSKPIEHRARYARLLWELGRKSEAEKLAREVLKEDERQRDATLVLAEVAAAKEDWAEVDRVLRYSLVSEVATRTPPDPRAIELLATSALRQDRAERARELFELGQTTYPLSTKWREGLIGCAGALDDEALMARTCEALAQIEYDDPRYPKLLAELAWKQGRFEDAAKWATETLFIDVLDASMHRLLGQALVRQGQYDTAKEELEVALELKPGELDTELALAECWYRSGEQDRAKDWLQQAQTEHPDDSQLKEALRQWQTETPLPSPPTKATSPTSPPPPASR